MTRDEVHALILSLPETAEGVYYGYPAYQAAGKFLTRLRSEDDSLVLHVDSLDHRDLLVEAEPETFHFTDHYRNYPMVLARIGKVDSGWLRAALIRRWRAVVPKKIQKLHPDF